MRKGDRSRKPPWIFGTDAVGNPAAGLMSCGQGEFIQMQSASQAFILHLQITEKDRREGGGKTDRQGERNAGRGSGGGEHRAGGTPRGGERRGGATREARKRRMVGKRRREPTMRKRRGRRQSAWVDAGGKGKARRRKRAAWSGAGEGRGKTGRCRGCGGRESRRPRCRGRDEAGGKAGTGARGSAGGAEGQALGTCPRRRMEDGAGGGADVPERDAGWRGGVPHAKTLAFEAEQPRAARKRVLHRIHDGPFGSIPRLPLGMRDKQIKGAGKLFPPAGCGAESRMLRRFYFRLTSDQDQMTRPTMDFCQSPSKSSSRLRTRGGLSAALSE